jgi:S-formylglutathione hydrolase FrmB
MKKIVFSILLIFLTSNVHSQTLQNQETTPTIESHGQYNCSTETLIGVSFKYCFKRGDQAGINQDIVYFLHGLEGNEKTWFSQKAGTAYIDHLWSKWGYNPSVVTISFGDAWILVNNPRFQLLSFFKKVVMPFLESKVGFLGQGRRILVGQSMGGLNAAIASLKSPGLFSKVALLCPAITNVGPFSSQQEIENYIERTGANPKRVNLMLTLSKKIFVNPLDWQNHDPLHLLKKYQGTKSKYYISTGVIDDYGFEEGTELFTRFSRQKGFHTWWVPAPGVHCDFDRPTTARFIMEGGQ